MASIPASEARKIYTSMLVELLMNRPKVSSFFRSFFKTKESATRYLTVEVERMNELVAVDVQRGSEGNFNKFSLATEKKFEPPYFREWFNMTEVDLYDRLIGTGDVPEEIFAQFIDNLNKKVLALINKIERAIELMCSQALHTGIVTMSDGSSIDFKRKASSMVDLTGTTGYWTTDTVDPITSLQTGCDFLRAEGQVQGDVFNVVFGAAAWNALLNNPKFASKADVRRFDLANIAAPQRNAVGGTLLGQITIGNYSGNCWGYTGGYKAANGTWTKYMNDKNVIILPEQPNFTLGFAAVPQVFGADGVGPEVTGQFHVNEKIDTFDGVHKRDVKSAPLPILTGVDEVYTAKVVS